MNFEEKKAAWLKSQPTDPLEIVRKFLQGHGDALSMQEIMDDAKSLAQIHPHTVKRWVDNLDIVLVDNTLPEGTLTDIVAWDANVALKEMNDENSRLWLQNLTNELRKILI